MPTGCGGTFAAWIPRHMETRTTTTAAPRTAADLLQTTFPIRPDGVGGASNPCSTRWPLPDGPTVRRRASNSPAAGAEKRFAFFGRRNEPAAGRDPHRSRSGTWDGRAHARCSRSVSHSSSAPLRRSTASNEAHDLGRRSGPAEAMVRRLRVGRDPKLRSSERMDHVRKERADRQRC